MSRVVGKLGTTGTGGREVVVRRETEAQTRSKRVGVVREGVAELRGRTKQPKKGAVVRKRREASAAAGVRPI